MVEHISFLEEMERRQQPKPKKSHLNILHAMMTANADVNADLGAMKLVKALLAYDVEVRFMDTSGYKDIGEMPQEVFQQRKEDAPFIDSDAYLFKIALMA